jgi:hypothetical protein
MMSTRFTAPPVRGDLAITLAIDVPSRFAVQQRAIGGGFPPAIGSTSGNREGARARASRLAVASDRRLRGTLFQAFETER